MSRVVLLSLCLLLPSVAAANIAAIQPNPAVLGAPGQSGPTALQVEDEWLELECRDEGARPVCDFLAIYRIRNRSAEPQTITAAFMGVRTEGVEVRVAGRRARHPLTKDEVRRIDEAARKAATKPGGWPASVSRREGLSREGFRLTLEAESETRIEVTGRARPGRLFVPSYASPAVKTRHPLLGTKPSEEEYDLEYLVAPIRTWGGVKKIQVTLRHPSEWKVRINTVGGKPKPSQSTTSAETRTVKLQLDAAAVDLLRVHITRPPRRFFNGGVLLGVGGTVDDPGGFRARLGYEVAAPDWLFYALTADTDFTDELVLTAMVEAASRGVFVIIPSLAVGLGVPVQIKPEITAGIRMQLTIQWPFIGFVTSVDLYPGLDTGGPGFFQATLLAQIGL